MNLTREEDEPFESARLYIESAKAHLEDFSISSRDFLNGLSYGTHWRTDPRSKERIFYARVNGKSPPRIRKAMTDTLVDLRHALDQAVYYAATQFHIENHRTLYFPFGIELENLEKEIKRKCRGIPVDLIDLIRSYKPYKNGNYLLWSLTRLAAYKHRGIIQIFADVGLGINPNQQGNINIRVNSAGGGKINFNGEVELARVAPNDPFECAARPTFSLVFGDTDVMKNEEVHPYLREILTKVEQIINDIAAKVIELKR